MSVHSSMAQKERFLKLGKFLVLYSLKSQSNKMLYLLIFKTDQHPKHDPSAVGMGSKIHKISLQKSGVRVH